VSEEEIVFPMVNLLPIDGKILHTLGSNWDTVSEISVRSGTVFALFVIPASARRNALTRGLAAAAGFPESQWR
jgi:hypothetical protein